MADMELINPGDASGRAGDSRYDAYNKANTNFSRLNTELAGKASSANVVLKSDIVDNLLGGVSDQVLSAAQGAALKSLIDGISLPDATVIIDDLTTGGSGSALSAEQGKVLKGLIDTITAGEGFPDVIDDLTTGGTTAALSAEQGVVLKGLHDTLNTRVGDLEDYNPGLVAAFWSRSIAVGADVGDAEIVVCGRVTTTGPAVRMVYRVTDGSAGGANDAADLLAGKIQFANSRYGSLISEDGRWYPEAFGAVHDGTTDDAAAINACRAYAITAGGGIVMLGPYSYVIGSTVTLETSAGFTGVQIHGCGPEDTILLAKPAAISTPILRFRGGSGNSTNKAVKGLTVRPFDNTYDNLGIGIQVENQCFAVVAYVKLQTLAVGLEIVNTTASGSFAEHNTFERLRTLNCTRAIQIHRRSGDASFHGQNFIACQIDVPSGGFGLYLNGSSIGGTAASGQAFLYNSLLDLKIFGGSGTRTAIYFDNLNTEGLYGNIVCEAALTLSSAANGVFDFGGFASTITSFTMGSGASSFSFKTLLVGKISATTKSAFSNASISSFTPHPAGNLLEPSRANTFAPAVIPMRGSNRESVGLVAFSGDAANGVYGLYSDSGSTNPSALSPGWFFRYNGTRLVTYGGRLDIGETGITDQLVIDDGRFGGKLGRLPPVTSVSAVGGPQNITLWQNNSTARSSDFYLRIQGTGTLRVGSSPATALRAASSCSTSIASRTPRPAPCPRFPSSRSTPPLA
jgi:hypothetical protein